MLLTLALGTPARAVIVLRDGGRNLSPPTGELARAGWQWEGDWHHFPGTVVGPHHFLTAAHTGGLPLEVFRFRGRDYFALEETTIPQTDIALWRVAGTFPDWAPLYDGSGEQGQSVFLCGRGTQRGDAVVVQGRLHGWIWGEGDGRLSWGCNRVADVVAGHSPDGRIGQLLQLSFDPTVSGAGLDTGSVSGGDSGGGVFLQDGGEWKLCGAVFGVENEFCLSPQKPQILGAAIFDGRGMFRSVGGNVFYVDPRTPVPISTTSLISRLSPYMPLIREAINRPPHYLRIAAWLTLMIVLPLVLGIAVAVQMVRRLTPFAASSRNTDDRSGPPTPLAGSSPPVSAADTTP